MKLSAFLNICTISLIVACYIPEIKIFTEGLLLPKWYLFIITILLSAAVCSLAPLCSRKTNLVSELRKVFHKIPELIIAVTLCECLYTLFMIATNGTDQRGVSGTFENPAGLAVCISIAIPMVIETINNKTTKFQNATDFAILCLFVIVLFLTKSRTAIIFLAIYAAIYAFKHLKIKATIKIALAIALAIATAAFVTTNKKDSTTGRIFILQNSIELIKRKPITGYGFKGFERNYMHQQETFFRANPNSEYYMLADGTYRPLNEFVYAQVNYGIFGLIGFIAVFIIPFIIATKKKDSKLQRLQYSVLAVLIFSLYSYPFSYPLCWLIMALNVILAFNAMIPIAEFHKKIQYKKLVYVSTSITCTAVLSLITFDAIQEYRWKKASVKISQGNTEGFADYQELFPYFDGNPSFLHNYAYELYFTGNYEAAAVIADKAIENLDDYKTRLLAGGAYLMQQKYAEAITHFESAHYMCPSRFGPLEGMYIAYKKSNQVAKQKQIADLIQKMPVKIQNPEAIRIKEQCK